MGRIGYITVRIALFSAVVFGAILNLSCSLLDRDFALPEPSVVSKGMLVLTFNSGLRGSKTLAPDFSMEPAFYDIAGIGPDPTNDHFERTVDLNEPNVGDLQVFDNLTPGEWTITVDARNAAGTVIGHGETNPPLKVGSGEPTPASIDVLPLSGTGALDLTVRWNEKVHLNVTLSRSLVSMSTGVDLMPVFTLTPPLPNIPKRAHHNNPGIETGYYLLQLQLLEGGVPFWGIAEAVRIIAGQTTTGSWDTTN